MICHTCGHHDEARTSVPEATLSSVQRHYTVDMHCHLLTPAVERLVESHPAKLSEIKDRVRLLGEQSVATNQVMLREIGSQLVDVERRLRDMQQFRVDLQVLSPSPTQYYYWADKALSAELVALQNEHIASVCAAKPDAFVGLGAVSLQHPDLAVSQLAEIQDVHKLRGVEISSDPTGKGLDDEDLLPFWAEAEQRGLAIFLHPLGTTLGERVNRYYLSNVIGQPLETTIAISQLIYSGVLDRYPDLKICAAHGGGYLPFYTGRFNHAFKVRPESSKCAYQPADYLSRLWYDTVVYEKNALAYLIEQVGAERVVAGSDYPFDMGEYELHRLIASLDMISVEQSAGILGANALRLLGLDMSQQVKSRRV